jgi:MEMO1 family protein
VRLKPDRTARPRLRRIEAFPVETANGRALGIRDPAGYTQAVLVLPPALVEVVSLFDGDHSIGDIQEALLRRHGELIDSGRIGGVVETLDEHGFLDSPGFAARRTAIEAEFRRSSTRPATHAGGAYADGPDALRAQMDAFFPEPEGPGPVRWGPGAGAPISGLVAPHIDFHRGGPVYAWGYRDLAERADADCFVILGTCHAGMPDPFALTLKDYDTPLGPAPVDREFADALGRRAGQDLLSSELAHRSEHSIEFQAVFLRYLYAGRREFTIVPVLASFVHEALARGGGVEDDPRVPAFLDALAETMAAARRRVCLVAGADLAHVGPRFGDPAAVTATRLREVEDADRGMLETVVAGDARAFFESAARDGDARRVCGLSPMYVLLRTLAGRRGSLRRYAQWPDPEGTVTFASVVIE